MFNTRWGIFETNSSSSHALILCGDAEYQLLQMGKAFIYGDNHVITLQEAKEIAKTAKYDIYGEKKTFEEIETMTAKEFSEWVGETSLCICDMEFFREEHGFDTFHETYTTKSGDIVHAFGSYE